MSSDRPFFRWTRYWCPRAGTIRLDESGYLSDPSGILGAALNPDVVTWASLPETRCLVLLGEPGIGKTSALRAWRESLKVVPALPGVRHVWLDAAGMTEHRLRRRLFDAPDILAWREGTDRLSLVIDSFDESGVGYLGTLLTDELEDWPRDRLSLVIACRTADWPAYLEESLRRLWPNDGVAVYELAPLTYRDVAHAASEALAERGDDFLVEISRLSLGSLASKPFTLRFLLYAFRENGCLPPSQVEVYEDGFRKLASEANERRRGERNTGVCTADQRLAIATRIAAVLAFAGRNAVSTDIGSTAVHGDAVTVAELAGGTEPTPQGPVTVTESAIHDTLACGLFSGRGPGKMGFWHRTAEDFLAARYVRERGLDRLQTRSLLTHAADPRGRIAPRLRTVAAWVAALVPGALPWICATDPEVLIGSDIQLSDPEPKAELVEIALGMFDREELVFSVLGPDFRLDRFTHPGLADQLRPWISAPGGGAGRVAALRFARDCRVRELEPEVLQIALDAAEPRRIRYWAMAAAATIASPEGLVRLRPLAFEETDGDPRESLRGPALEILFPEHLSLDEVLAVLTTLGTGSDAVEGFLWHVFPDHVADGDLPRVLRWVAEEGRSRASVAARRMAEGLLRRAWPRIEEEEVRDAIARVAWSHLVHDERVFDRSPFGTEAEADLLDDPAGRRLLLAGIVPLLKDPAQDAWHLHGSQALLHSEDVPWMVEQAIADPDHASLWANVISRSANLDDARVASAILMGAERSPAIRERFSWALGSIDLASEHARRVRADHQREARREERSRRERARRFTPTAPEIERLLRKAETEVTASSEDSQFDAFWHLMYVLRFRPDGVREAPEGVLDVTELPGWQAATPETRVRVLSAARAYLLGRVPDQENPLHRPAVASYMAFRQLGREDPSWVARLDPSVWERWLPTLIAIELRVATERDRDLTVLRAAKKAGPEAFADALLEGLRAQIEEGSSPWAMEALGELLDEPMIRRISAWLPNLADRPGVHRELLRRLVQLGSRSAINAALEIVTSSPWADDDAKWTAVEAGRALLAFEPDTGWPVLWKAMESDPEFGERILGASEDHLSESRSLAAFPAQRLADVYVWLARRSDTRPRARHAGELPSRLERVESRVLELLSGRADQEAIDALHRVVEELPGRRWLRRTLRRVQGQRLEATWVAPSPHEILALDGERHNRLIRSDAHLATLVLESLGRLEDRLQGPNPPAFALWDEISKGRWRPKEEERLSDFIKDHLLLDLGRLGLLVNREVEILKKQGGAPGEETDILVAVSIPGGPAAGRSTASVVVEVKGPWNRDLLTAMETQLCDRYLARTDTTVGIYCVGWYGCPQWDPEDYRWKRVPAGSLADLREQLESQASALTDETRTVMTFVLDATLP